MTEPSKPTEGSLEHFQSLYPPVVDPKTGATLTLTGPQLEQALVGGEAAFKPGSRVPVISDDGREGTVPAENVSKVLGQGFKLDNPTEQAARHIAATHPIAAGVIAAGHQVSEAFKVPFTPGPDEMLRAVLPGKQPDEKLVKAVQERSEEEHPIAAGTARVAAEVLPMLTGIGEVGEVGKAGLYTARGARALATGEKVGALALREAPAALSAGSEALGKAGLTALAEDVGAGLAKAAPEALTKAAPSMGRRIAGAAAEHGLQGALQSTPEAARQAFDGDPERAAETLMWGAGIGALFGGAGKAMGLGAKAAANPAERYAEKLARGIVAEPEAALGKVTGKLAEKGVNAVGGGIGAGIGGAFGGHVGAMIGAGVGKKMTGWASELAKEAAEKWAEGEGGQVASKYLKSLAEAPLERGLGKGLFEQGISSAGQKLAMVPATIASMSGAELNRISKEHERRRFSAEEAASIAAAAQKLASSPQSMMDLTADLAAPLDHSPSTGAAALQFQGKLTQAVHYIADQAPKPPRPADPFERTMWQPGPLELAALGRKLEVVHDPFSVIARMADGTLTKDHVEALDQLYPKLAEDIRKAVIGTAALPNAPKLSLEQRQKLGVLLGTPMGALSTPDSMRSLQAGFQPQPQAGGPPPGAAPAAKAGPGRPPKLSYSKLPSTQTHAQRIEMGSK